MNIEDMSADALGIPSREKTMEQEVFRQACRTAKLERLVYQFRTALREHPNKMRFHDSWFGNRDDGVMERFRLLLVEQGWFVSTSISISEDGCHKETTIDVSLFDPATR